MLVVVARLQIYITLVANKEGEDIEEASDDDDDDDSLYLSAKPSLVLNSKAIGGICCSCCCCGQRRRLWRCPWSCAWRCAWSCAWSWVWSLHDTCLKCVQRWILGIKCALFLAPSFQLEEIWSSQLPAASLLYIEAGSGSFKLRCFAWGCLLCLRVNVPAAATVLVFSILHLVIEAGFVLFLLGVLSILSWRLNYWLHVVCTYVR